MVGMLHEIAHLPNIKISGVDMAQFVLILFHDHNFQLVDGFATRNPNPEGAFNVVSKNRTVEQDFDFMVHDEGFG